MKTVRFCKITAIINLVLGTIISILFPGILGNGEKINPIEFVIIFIFFELIVITLSAILLALAQTVKNTAIMLEGESEKISVKKNKIGVFCKVLGIIYMIIGSIYNLIHSISSATVNVGVDKTNFHFKTFITNFIYWEIIIVIISAILIGISVVIEKSVLVVEYEKNKQKDNK